MPPPNSKVPPRPPFSKLHDAIYDPEKEHTAAPSHKRLSDVKNSVLLTPCTFSKFKRADYIFPNYMISDFNLIILHAALFSAAGLIVNARHILRIKIVQ
jgi:hypothetical protein